MNRPRFGINKVWHYRRRLGIGCRLIGALGNINQSFYSPVLISPDVPQPGINLSKSIGLPLKRRRMRRSQSSSNERIFFRFQESTWGRAPRSTEYESNHPAKCSNLQVIENIL